MDGQEERWRWRGGFEQIWIIRERSLTDLPIFSANYLKSALIHTKESGCVQDGRASPLRQMNV